MNVTAYCILILGLLLLVGFANASTLTATFNGTPTIRQELPAIIFMNQQIGGPSKFAWFVGGEDYTQPWVNITGSPGWTARTDPQVVYMPNGDIILMGGDVASSLANVGQHNIWKSSDSGVTWVEQNASSVGVITSDSPTVAMPDGSIVAMASFSNIVSRSTDAGITWSTINASTGWGHVETEPLVVLPNGNLVLMGGLNFTFPATYTDLNFVWRSTDMGTTWTEVNANASWSPREGASAVAMPDGSIILMGGLNRIGPPHNVNNETWRSTDEGVTWTEVNASSGWRARYYFNAVLMPDNNIVIMGGSDNRNDLNDTWRSTDGGVHWTEINQSAGWQVRSGSASVVTSDGSIILFGGANWTTYINFNDTWRFQPFGIFRSISPNWLRSVFLE
jgi:hypothetical protein